MAPASGNDWVEFLTFGFIPINQTFISAGKVAGIGGFPPILS
jgi:hypothetical protein